MTIETLPALRPSRAPWNKGRIIGQKLPLQPKHVWFLRVRLEMADNRRDLALFNRTVDSKLRGCDLVGLRVNDVYAAGHVKERASVTQSKTRKPVRSRSPRPRDWRWNGGSRIPKGSAATISGPAVFTPARTSRRANMPGSCATGFFRSDSGPVPMARIRCGARRLRRSPRRPEIWRRAAAPGPRPKMDSTVRYLGVDLEDALGVSLDDLTE